ncbi:MAG: sulfite exporter TauE/SafE family protein [Burkholderiales bacterium]|nr:sulfite exporter TauE/SafE family protein [Burkholderiales bacterium]MDE2397044.1 sulfite exporter TauE/SafE family protein [Burkholderiales bacterium]MDE2452842.1 sulfite exporter TauE/SafE family protein [Burkholderiales bacterium]
MDAWITACAGFGVGAIVGVTGVGGGSLMAPILVLLFGVAPVAAVGTDLWFAAITKLVGGWVHHQRGGVDTRVLRLLCMGSLPTSIATLVWLHLAHVGRMQNGLLMAALGAVLLLTALAMVFKSQAHEIGRRLRSTAPDAFKRAQPALTVVAGAILGLLVTLTSIGAGALGSVMLVYLYPYRMTPSRLVGTDIVHAIPLTIIAGTGHLLMGNVDLKLLGTLLLGSIPGIVIGSMLMGKLPERALRLAIAAVLTVSGIKLLG